MGSLGAMAMSEEVQGKTISIDQALLWHLQSNHYPPHPSFMVPVCKRALEKANKGLWDKKIRMPEGVEHRVFGKLVPVSTIIDAFHLDHFLDTRDDEDIDYLEE